MSTLINKYNAFSIVIARKLKDEDLQINATYRKYLSEWKDWTVALMKMDLWIDAICYLD